MTDDEGGQFASPVENWFEGRRVKLVAAADLALGDLVWFNGRWMIVGQAPFTHGDDTDFGLFLDDPAEDGGTWDMHVDSADDFRVALDA